jgi:hypothetical protein
MTKKLWIFGDSYAERKNNTEYSYSWPIQLENNFDVTNFACEGTSSNWSLQILLSEIDKTKNATDISVLFFLTEPYRQDWNFWKDKKHHWLNGYIGGGRGRSITDATELVNQYKDYSKFIKTWFKSLPDNFEDMEYYKNIGLINLFASKFEKILIWPCFHQVKLSRNVNSNVALSSISMRTFESIVDPTRFDIRPNHLSVKNHKRMTSILTHWINENELNFNV